MLIFFLLVSFYLYPISPYCLNLNPLTDACGLCSSLYYPNLSLSWQTQQFSLSDCIPKKQILYKKEIFITSTNNCLYSCNGTIDFPYNDIFTAFQQEMKYSIFFFEIELNFLLMGSTPHFLYNNTNENNKFLFFRRQYVNMTLKPLYCIEINVTGCMSSTSKKPRIYMKSKNLMFFISYQMKIENIEFYGVDMNLNYDPSILNTSICETSDLESNDNNSQCYLMNSMFIAPIKLDYYGLFNLEFLYDCITCIYPKLLIYNCSFLYMNPLGDGINVFIVSLISIVQHSPNYIKLSNNIIDKSWFLKGIINFINEKDDFYQLSKYNQINYLFSQNQTQYQVLCYNNTIQNYNYYNIKLPDQVYIVIFNLDVTSFGDSFNYLPQLVIYTDNERYINNTIISFSAIFNISMGFNKTSIITINKLNIQNNSFDYFILLYSLIVSLNINNSIFFNNTKMQFNVQDFNIVNFTNFIVDQHVLITNEFFELNSNFYNFFDSSFKNIRSSSSVSPFYMFDISTYSSSDSLSYSDGTITNDHIMFFNVSFMNFTNINILDTDYALNTFEIYACFFINISIVSKNLFTVNIEKYVIVQNTSFLNISVQMIFFHSFCADVTLINIKYVLSNSYFGMFLLNIVIKRLLIYIENVVFNNIYITFFLTSILFNINPIYSGMDVDCLISDISFTDIIALPNTNYFTIFSLYECTTLFLNEISFQNISNAYLFNSNQEQYSNEVNTLNISNFKVINNNQDIMNFITFTTVDYLYISNSYFYSERPLAQSSKEYEIELDCYLSCSVVIVNTVFDNTDSNSAGALSFYYFLSYLNISIYNCTFINNQRKTGGSDLLFQFMNKIWSFTDYQQLHLKYDDSSILKNFTLNQTETMIKNQHTFNFSIYTHYLENLTGIRNCLFSQTNNYENSSIEIQGGEMIMIDCMFNKKKGSLFNLHQNTSILIYNSQFIECSSQSSGGSIFLQNSDILLANSKFYSGSSGDKGGVIYAYKSNLYLYNNSFTSSMAYGEGGVLYILSSYLIFLNSYLDISISKAKGGAIYIDSSFFINQNCDISNGYAFSDGSSIYAVKNYIMNISNMKIQNNRVNSSVFYVIGDWNNEYFMANISFYNNSGGVFVLKEGKISIFNISFYMNYGSPYVMNAFSSFKQVSMNMTLLEFKYNDFETVFSKISYGVLVFRNFTFYSNYTEKTCFSMEFSSLSLYYSQMIIFNADINSFILTSNLINTGYLLELSNTNLEMSNVSIDGGSILGGIFLDTSQIFINDSALTNCNKLTQAGAAIKILHSYPVDIEYTVFSNNTADNGASIYLSDSFLYLMNCSFINNVVSSKGSCIYSINPILGNSIMILITYSYFQSYNQLIYIEKALKFDFYSSMVNSSRQYINDNLFECNQIEIINLNDISCKDINSNISPFMIINDQNSFYEVNITYSSFDSCSSDLSGGVFYIKGLIMLTITNTNFTNNFAGLSGGAIYFECHDPNCSNHLFNRNLFINNTAIQYGGAIKAPKPMNYDVFTTNRFFSNKAYSGNEFSTDTQYFNCMYNSDKNQSVVISLLNNSFEVISGQKIQLTCLLYDFFDSPLVFEETGYILISFYDSSIKVSNNQISVSDGQVKFTELLIIGKPGISSQGAITLKINEIILNYTIKFNFLLCSRGEIYLNFQCIPCSSGFYSLEDSPFLNNKSTCDLCPSNAVCPGGDMIIPKPGFWRMNNKTSIIIVCDIDEKCPDQSQLANINDTNYSFECGAYYYGYLCANCQQGYYENSIGECKICKNLDLYYLIVVSGIIAFTVFLVYQSKKALEFEENESKERSMLKILINHINYLSFLNSCSFDFTFPPQILYLLQINEDYFSMLSQNVFNFDCMLMDMLDKENIVIGRFVLRALSPIFFFLISLFVIILLEIPKLISKLKKNKKKQKINNKNKNLKNDTLEKLEKSEISQRNRENFNNLEIDEKKNIEKDGEKYINNNNNNEKEKEVNISEKLTFFYKILNFVGASFIICIFNFYSQILINTFRMVKCETLDESNTSYLITDPNIECWNSQKHLNLINNIFVPNLILWCFGWPLLLFTILRLYKRSYMKKIEQKFLNERSMSIKKNPSLKLCRLSSAKMDKIKRPSLGIEKKPLFKELLKGTNQNSWMLKEKKASMDLPDEIVTPKENYNKEIQLSIKFPKKSLSSKYSLSKLWRKASPNRNNKACFILSNHQEQILFKNNKVILFLTIDYKYKCYYWETFFYLTNLLLSIFFTFSMYIGFNINIVGASIILLYLFMLIITEVKRPFKYEFINNLACFSYLVSILNVSFTMMSSLKENSDNQNSVYLILIVIANIGYIVLWVYSFNMVKMKVYMPKLKRFLYLICSKLKF